MKLNKRAVALLVSLMLLLTAAVGSTVAFIVDQSDDVENVFQPSWVACEVVKGTDGSYTVKNTGDTDAYIRVAVQVNWKNTEGQIYAQAPTFAVTHGGDWVLGKDGYYYYTKPVTLAADEIETSALKVTPTSVAPDDDHVLFVEVVASAIQATSAAVNDWSSGVATAATDGAVLTVTTP